MHMPLLLVTPSNLGPPVPLVHAAQFKRSCRPFEAAAAKTMTH